MIELNDLQKVINQKTVIDIQELVVENGQITAFIGAVDSGMDILFQLLIGQTRPTGGTIRFAKIDPYFDHADFSRNVGVVFAADNLYKRQSPLANLKFYCRLYRLPSSRAVDILSQVGLADQADTPVEKLSPSLLRRLAFGRAILHQPNALIIEEPFIKCDEASISLLSKVIRLQAEAGAAVVVLSESTDHLSILCDDIFRLEKGKLVELFENQDLHRPDLPFMIPVKLEGKVILVDPAEIYYIMAQDDRTVLQTIDGKLPAQFSMTELEQRLFRSGFFRAHRGYLVNLQHVKEVIPYTRDSYTLRLKDESATEIPLSKVAARELRDLFGY